MNTTVSEGNTKVQLELNALVQLVTQLKTEELQKFARQINQIVAERLQKQPSQEDELLKKTQVQMSSENKKRYEYLAELASENMLSQEQLKEYTILIEQSEKLNVIRMKAAAELAKIRQVDFKELLVTLNLVSPVYD